MMGFFNNIGFSLFLFLLSFIVIIPTLQARIVEYDSYWAERQLQALKNLNDSYHPNPEEVTKEFNDHVARTLMGLNTTRRYLKEKNGPCEANNPIDKCWRCDPDWETNRQKMADCALGFGRGTTGGKGGEIYNVTSEADDPLNPEPGTLRYGVIQKKPLWIIFTKNYTFNLKEELIMQGDKTIDGRGANINIAGGASISIHFVKNIIISNIHIHDIKATKGGKIKDCEDHLTIRTKSDGDGINIFGGTNIWIDHLSITKCGDGIIDAIEGSTAITISNCHFTDHNDVMLFGARDDVAIDEKMQITVAFNHFGKGLVQRMPRVRTGFVHVVNNDYTHWIMFAIGGGSHPTIISQGNRFCPTNIVASKEVTKRDVPKSEWEKWDWVTEGDEFENGAFFTPSGDPKASKKFGSDKMIPFKPGKMVPTLTADCGQLPCSIGKGC